MTILQPLQNLWDSKLKEYHQKLKKAEKETVHQITQTTTLVRQRLREKKLLKKRRITNRLVPIEGILNGKEKICLQPYYEVANERLESLLLLLFNIGEQDILSDLVNIHYPREKSDPKAKPYIHEFVIVHHSKYFLPCAVSIHARRL